MNNTNEELRDRLARSLLNGSFNTHTVQRDVDISDLIAEAEVEINELMTTFISGVHQTARRVALEILTRQLGHEEDRPRRGYQAGTIAKQRDREPTVEEKNRLADSCRMLRMKRGWSQQTLGDKLGCHLTTVGNWEKQKSFPALSLIKKLNPLLTESELPEIPELLEAP